MSAVCHSRNVCCVTPQTCLLCLSWQTCLLCDTADMCRHVYCATQHTCILCQAADVSAASHSKHGCCVAQQTTSDMAAMSQSRQCLLCREASSACKPPQSRRQDGQHPGWPQRQHSNKYAPRTGKWTGDVLVSLTVVGQPHQKLMGHKGGTIAHILHCVAVNKPKKHNQHKQPTARRASVGCRVVPMLWNSI